MDTDIIQAYCFCNCYNWQGLIPAMQEVMPGVPHRYCVMHLWRNFTKQWKDKELRGVVWECARATTPIQFNRIMERLKRLNEKVWEYLNKWPKEAWTKAYFSENCKADNIVNNACEVFNANFLNYRGKPILTLAEDVRCYVMRKLSHNKMKLDGRAGPLCPWQQSRLEKEKLASHNWTPVWSGDNPRQRYQIENNCRVKVDVDIFKQTCTCRFWQLTGKCCIFILFCWFGFQ